MQLTGSGFAADDVVQVSGGGDVSVFDVTVVSANEIDFGLGVSIIQPPGPHDVTVTSPACGTSGTLSGGITVNPGPKITALSPDTVTAGDADDTVVITGGNFAHNATLAFTYDQVAITSISIDSDTQITIRVAVVDDGVDDILRITNPDDAGTVTATLVVEGRTGPAVFRDGQWFVRHSLTSGVADHVFGYGNPGDQPVACGFRNLVVYRDAQFYFSFFTVPLGNPGDVGICGTWGFGFDFLGPDWGVYRPSTATFYLQGFEVSLSGPEPIVREIHFGDVGDRAVVGDWNGDGTTDIGVVRDGVWYLVTEYDATSHTAVAAVTLQFGDPGDVPVVGDWNGDGTDSPGVFRSGVWFTRNELTTGIAEATFSYADPGDIPLVYVS